MPRRKGRGSISKTPRLKTNEVPESENKKEQVPVKNTGLKTITLLSFPVSEKDEEIVECSICNTKSTFREFRIHNISQHYNIASTVGDNVELDYRYFVKQLTDMGRLKKISTFVCPHSGCTSKYKSALGLAYHLELCGKTEAEKLANYVKCDICGKSLSKTGINQHRKLHVVPEERVELVESEADPDIIVGESNRRRSAIRAQQIIKKAVKASTKEVDVKPALPDDDFVKEEKTDEEDEDDDEDSAEECEVKPKRAKHSKATSSSSTTNNATITTTKKFLTLTLDENEEVSNEEESDAWDRPERVSDSVFSTISFVNPLTSFDDEDEARLYLPSALTSIEFSTKAKDKITDFHHISLFESEITDSESGNNVINVGGPVSSISWHPSGKYLAVSTLMDFRSKPNILELEGNLTCIQLYKNSYDPSDDGFNGLDLELVIAVSNGFIHHLQWSSFWPSECDVDKGSNSFVDDVFGHLAYACGDSTVAISFIQKSDLDKQFNVSVSSSVNISSDLPRMIRLYKKVPEVILRLSDSHAKDSGQCITFDWHEKTEYLAAGYGKGLIALFSLRNTSPFVRTKTSDSDGKSSTVEIQPIWYIRAHTDAVTSIHFNPTDPRYFVSGSYDCYVKTWDFKLRQEMESKKVGMVLAASWIRGWVHVAISSEMMNVNFQAAGSNNMVRYFQIGSSVKNYVTCAEQFNVTSLSFYEGMLALGGEAGRVTVVYYDQYLRECDYDRNKKKKNTVNFSKVIVEKNPKSKQISSSQDIDSIAKGRRLIFNLDKFRRESYQAAADPTMKELESFINSYSLIRINKVSWCPSGQQLAIGYFNGFLVVTPTSYSDLYGDYYTVKKRPKGAAQ